MKRFSSLAIVAGALAAVTLVFVSTLDAPRSSSTPVGPGVSLHENHIVRNVVLGNSIRVCAEEYSLATAEAVRNINSTFRSSALVDFDIFVIDQLDNRNRCPSKNPPNQVDYVHVDAANCFRLHQDYVYETCSGHSKPLSAPYFAHHGFYFLLIYPHSYYDGDFLTPSNDSATNLPLVRVITRELFFLLGAPEEFVINDVSCSKSPRTQNIESVMHCREHWNGKRPIIQPYDITTITKLYRPNQLGNVSIEEDDGMVAVAFNASAVRAVEKIELRRRTGTSWGTPIETWDLMNAGELRAFSVGAGVKTYALFRRTAVLEAEQAPLDGLDPDGPLIGFKGDDHQVGAPVIIDPPDLVYYDVTVTTPVGSGTIVPKPKTWVRVAGHRQTFTATPDSGHRVKTWTGDCAGMLLTNAPETPQTCLLVINGDKTVGVTFEQAPVVPDCTRTLTISHGSNGSTSPAAGKYQVACDGSRTITATANSGYDVGSWSGACSGSGSSCTVFMRNAPRSAGVSFVEEPDDPDPPTRYALSLSSTGTGTISAEGTSPYLDGTDVTVTATWNDDTHSMSWGGACSGSPSSSPATCSVSMSSAKSVSATFTKIVVETPTCTQVVEASPSDAGTPGGGGTYDCADGNPRNGRPPAVTQSAATCYTFDDWTYSYSGTTRTATANYTERTFTTVYASQPPAAWSAPSSVTWKCTAGEPSIPVPDPNTCYVFDEWTLRTIAGTLRIRTANFDAGTATLTTSSSNSNGYATGGGTHTCFTWVSVSAVATEDDWVFDGWSGPVASASSSTTSVYMDRDKSVTATFSHICDVSSDHPICSQTEPEPTPEPTREPVEE